MRQTITEPFVDTRAADLTWTLEHPPVEPLAARVLESGDGAVRIELRILGASHQVLLEAGRERLAETVACLPGAAGGLPRHAASSAAGPHHYDFASSVRRLGPEAFAEEVAQASLAVADHPRGLLATFPGDSLAVTGLVTETDGRTLRWRSWHAYPQSGELVTTTTSVSLRRSTPRPETETPGDAL
ncbi:hypothetical protein HDA32_001365 [Spinactinospora alkalitolerans]|uniref:DUF2617 family protein n=1 Tax=Spinactinospora alkalitolerans TaxID=687207 RepID=A0A852TRS2_9ACTN|nr:DUF2617 family protein [Spinactinospora alkalitolerans]NYE46245.1 hypothetical protein [Spinactinospora alkalitolerans]